MKRTQLARSTLHATLATVAAMLAAGLAGATPRAASAARLVTVGRTVNISAMHHNQTETGVAVNPTNPLNVVVTSNIDSGNALFEASSMDGGKTWTRHLIADGGRLGSACCDSNLAFDRYGNLFLVYLFATAGTVPIALSTDGGVSFHPLAIIKPTFTGGPARPGKGAPRRPLASADQPSITTGAGSVWVTYTSSTGAHIQAAGAAVTGLGHVGPFSHPETAKGANAGDYGDVAIGPHGEVLVTYQNPTVGQGPATIYTDLDPDGLGPLGFQPARVVTKTGVGGFDYIPAQPNRSVDAEAGLAWDTTGGPHRGRVYLLWTQERPNESDDLNILVRSSDDRGTTWSPDVQVNDDGGAYSQFLPRIALDPTTGNLAVSFYDSRLDRGTGGFGDTDGYPNDDAQFWAAVSTDGGASFSRNVRVSAGTSNAHDAHNGIDYGDYTALDFYGGIAYPVWADNSNSTGDNPDGALHQLDQYTARVKVV